MENNDIFEILEELKKRALGISDDPAQNREPKKGFIVSFLQTGISINPDDYANPYTGILNSGEDPAATPKRIESFINLNELVDKKLLLDGSGTEIAGSSRISDSYKAIVESANALPGAISVDPAIKKACEEALKIIKNQDNSDTEAYIRYKEYSEKYDIAFSEYEDAYGEAQANPIKAQLWPRRGVIYRDKVNAAWSAWVVSGKKNEVEKAISFLEAQGTDISASVIEKAEQIIRSNTFDIGRTPLLNVRVRPSNWYEPEATAGWTTYTYSKSHRTGSTVRSNRNWSGKTGLWFSKASASGSTVKEDIKTTDDSLSITFNYAFVNIDRPYMSNLLFNLPGWFLKGGKKSCISNGTVDQNNSENEVLWLPAIPTKLLVIKNVTIKSTAITNMSSEIKQTLDGGGSIGFGSFSGSGNYSRGSSTVKTGVEQTAEGLIIHGAIVAGHVQEIITASPRIDDPSLSNN